MINLITGLPGAAKTLFTIGHVKKLAEKENRPVFYSGIPGLNKDRLAWQEIDAERWFECPAGSIVIIDECQRVFRPRTISKEIPEFVSKLETHRHQGIDLYLITQHPMLADSAIRRLTGNHRHIVRRFGMQSSTVHQWEGVREQCEKSSARVDSNKTVFSFDKSIFELYKSAELHTVKRSIPARAYFLLAVPIVIAFAIWYMYRFTHEQGKPLEHGGHVTAAQSGGVSRDAPATYMYKNAVDDVKEYIYKETPRISELPYSAPKYDKLTEPTVAPFPVGCVRTAHSCQCYSQQATPIKTTPETCNRIIDDGIFEDFDVNGQPKLDAPQDQRLSDRPAAAPVYDVADSSVIAAPAVAPEPDEKRFFANPRPVRPKKS